MKRLSLLGLLGLFVAGAASISSVGCGYALVGTGKGSLPDGVKTVWVPTFTNETAKVGLEQILTEAVVRELSARRRLRPASDRSSADAELEGRLVSFSVTPVRFDDAGRALEYQIAVAARLKLVERSSERTLYEDTGFTFRQPYSVPASAGSYFDPETAALDELSRPFARSLVTTILEGF